MEGNGSPHASGQRDRCAHCPPAPESRRLLREETRSHGPRGRLCASGGSAMTRMRPRHVRTRLTLWYVGVLAGVLILYVAGTSTFLFLNLRQELDRSTIQDLETVEGLLNFGPDGTLRLGTGYEDVEEHEVEQERFMEVRDLNGALLYRNKRLRNWILGGSPAPGEGKVGYSERSARLPDGTRIRLVSRVHTVGSRSTLIRLAHSEEPLWHEFRE